MVPKPLTINANTAPFKSSRLAIPPSPFSPRLPLTPPATPPKAQLPRPSNKRALSSPSTPPPSAPLNWLWQCHVCYRAYPLGATRRCLDDGHYFCSGTTAVSKRKGKASSRRTKRHRACASEFDYSSWKAWGEWRRSEDALLALHRKGGGAADADDDNDDDVDAMSVDSGYVSSSSGDRASLPSQMKAQTKDCWNTCDYPSECRWGSQYGVQSSTTSSTSSTSQTAASGCNFTSGCAPSSSSLSQDPLTSTPHSPLSLQTQPLITTTASPAPYSPTNTYTPPTTFDGILEGTPLASALASASASLSPTSPKDVRERFWDTLLDAARQRKRSSSTTTTTTNKKNPGSPLAKAVITLPAVVEEDEDEGEELGEGDDVEGVMEKEADGETMSVPLFFDAVEQQQQQQQAEAEDGHGGFERHLELDLELQPPALPEPSLSWQGAAALNRSSTCGGNVITSSAASTSTGRAFDFGFADKVQGALAGSAVVVAVLSNVRNSARGEGEHRECVKAGRLAGAGMGRARRRLVRRKTMGL
ncbi:hypothetical protein IWX49DRAFT_630308 [Phyllosticta citricarpa]|uniref:Uncharacterized protein n=2 Tax=Phyllosticta TaxID=121621 RepID=A0ABR1ML42_9PEZI